MRASTARAVTRGRKALRSMVFSRVGGRGGVDVNVDVGDGGW